MSGICLKCEKAFKQDAEHIHFCPTCAPPPTNIPLGYIRLKDGSLQKRTRFGGTAADRIPPAKLGGDPSVADEDPGQGRR